MGEIINTNTAIETQPGGDTGALLDITQSLLADARIALNSSGVLSVPIAELSTLGAGVSSLIPALNTVTQTTSIAADGLYTIANAGVGDVLKAAKNGNFWASLKTADGASKMVQLQEAGAITATTQTAAAFNPATMMMAVALFSIEQELGEIEDMQRQIISFLEIEKESEIEADVESLMSIIKKYKDNWDNERFVSGNHNQVLTYQNRARKNMLGYQQKVQKQQQKQLKQQQKKIVESIGKKPHIVTQAGVKQAFASLEKEFKYYRLSLYTFSLSSLMEVMLSGNFKESYISGIRDELQQMSDAYRDLFEESSHYLEKLSNSAVDANVMKGIGTAGNAVGKFIGSIPLVKEGPVDEFLQDGGIHLKKSALDMEKDAVHRFASIGNPGTRMFMEKMDEMIQIYNRTEQICFDDKKIYLLPKKLVA